MKNVYLIQFSLSKGNQQPEIMQALKTSGAEVIQKSAGLCAKSTQSEKELRETLGDFSEGLMVESLTAEKLKDQAESVRAFVENA